MTTERAFTARSVIASLLLGLRDPELPASALVRSGRRLGVAEGTVRVALSRMVGSGDLELADGRYRLAGSLLERHRRQETGRRPDHRRWDGTWLIAIMGADGVARSAAARAATRQDLAAFRLAPWREGVWLRPDNLAPPEPNAESAGAGAGRSLAEVTWLRSATFVVDAEVPALVERLWSPASWAADARCLLADLEAHRPGEGASEVRGPSPDRVGSGRAGTSGPGGAPGSGLSPGSGGAPGSGLSPGSGENLAVAFRLAAAVVRHLRDDPLLPIELLPADWPGPDLRAAYDAYESAFQRALRDTATP